eukprot:COSAG05_NODE_22736_length_262_cov_2.828221_1_plen_82_part_01
MAKALIILACRPACCHLFGVPDLGGDVSGNCSAVEPSCCLTLPNRATSVGLLLRTEWLCIILGSGDGGGLSSLAKGSPPQVR